MAISILPEALKQEKFRPAACDVVVCEAFVGNVILKLYEGVGSVMIKKIKEGMMSDSENRKIGAHAGQTGTEKDAEIL